MESNTNQPHLTNTKTEKRKPKIKVIEEHRVVQPNDLSTTQRQNIFNSNLDIPVINDFVSTGWRTSKPDIQKKQLTNQVNNSGGQKIKRSDETQTSSLKSQSLLDHKKTQENCWSKCSKSCLLF